MKAQAKIQASISTVAGKLPFQILEYTVKPLSKRQKIGFQDQLSLNAGQKYCRMLQGEHSAIISTFIKLPFVIKVFVLSFLSGRFTVDSNSFKGLYVVSMFLKGWWYVLCCNKTLTLGLQCHLLITFANS